MGKRTNTLEIIARRIQYCKIPNPSDEDLAEYLRSNYPFDYSRTKVKQLVSMAGKARAASEKRKRKEEEEDEKEEIVSASSPSRKRVKKKKGGASEERLQRMEIEHRRSNFKFHGTDSSEVSTSEEESDDEEEEDEEPKMDLMKEELRVKYIKQAEKAANVEVEMVETPARGVKLSKKLKSGQKVSDGFEVKKEEGKKEEEGPRFRDLGGMDDLLEELKMKVLAPLCHPQPLFHLGVRPLGGILLCGPPGCGKTMLADAIAKETGLPYYKISSTDVVSGVSGATEENIRELFAKARRTAPSIVFIDEIDAIALKRESQKDLGRRIVTQLMTCMDESRQTLLPGASSTPGSSDQVLRHVLVIGATNHPDEVDSALRRPGRFDWEINLRVPDENARMRILSVLTRNIKLEGTFDLLKIGRSTPGFVGADLASLVNEAGQTCLTRMMTERKMKLSEQLADEEPDSWWKRSWSPEDLENLSMTMADFEEAVKKVQPSSRREGFSKIPVETWEDVGGLGDVRKVFNTYLVKRIKSPEIYKEFGVDFDTGFLLYGPPGCGKTLLAKAVANEAGANFIHVKGPEILNKYVGQSELEVRKMFSRARACPPCILFFDEVDALTAKRGKDGGWVAESVANQLLMELDGGDKRNGVYVIGATNRLGAMDTAFLRPGRFGMHLYVGPPSPDQRVEILKAHCRKKPVDEEVDLEALARSPACENFSGANLADLVNATAHAAIEGHANAMSDENSPSEPTKRTIKLKHFEQALGEISVSTGAPKSTEKTTSHMQKLVGGISGSIAE